MDTTATERQELIDQMHETDIEGPEYDPDILPVTSTRQVSGNDPEQIRKQYRVNPDMVPLLLRREGTAAIRSLWRDTLSARDPCDPECHHRKFSTTTKPQTGKERLSTAHILNKFDLLPGQRNYGTDHPSWLQRSRTQAELPIPPQQLDRDPSIVMKRTLPDIREKRLKTANFYTAVTRRAPLQSKTLSFDALNRPPVPAPQLLDKTSPEADAYKKINIATWINEVKKVVPTRIPVSIPANMTRSSRQNDPPFRISYMRMTEPNFVHVHHVQPERHYTINPEWCSERPNMTFLKPGHGPLSW